jgi:tetrapyrrole methylase family protein/MazG family protein
VVFHAQIAKEHADFVYDDAVNAVCKKMIQRHPHIFGDVKADTAQEVLNNWESIKREQRGQTHSEVLRSVIRSLPALSRAEKVGDKARHAGFDFADAKEALIKLREEIEEFVAEMDSPQSDEAFMEMGDLLFATVNLARKCGIQPEMALNKATDKFVSRFCLMEEAVINDGKSIKELDMKQLDEYWDKIKGVK